MTPDSGRSHGRSPDEEHNVETVLKMYADGWGATPGWQNVWRRHAVDDMVSFFNGNPEPTKNLEQFLAFQEGLFGGFPTLRTQVTDVTVEASIVIVQSKLDGAHDGEFLGVPPSGARVTVPDITVFRLESGKIVEMKYFTDLLAVMTAIGHRS